MTHETVTQDLSRFGNRELGMAADLLKALSENTHDVDMSGLGLYFNQNSGCVFLSNEDCNVWMMNGDSLEMWYSCPICGHEGFLDDMPHSDELENDECFEYCKDIGAIK